MPVLPVRRDGLGSTTTLAGTSRVARSMAGCCRDFVGRSLERRHDHDDDDPTAPLAAADDCPAVEFRPDPLQVRSFKPGSDRETTIENRREKRGRDNEEAFENVSYSPKPSVEGHLGLGRSFLPRAPV